MHRTLHGHDATDVANSNASEQPGGYATVGAGLLKSEGAPPDYSTGLGGAGTAYPSIMRLPVGGVPGLTPTRPPSGPAYSYAGAPGTTPAGPPVGVVQPSEYNNNRNNNVAASGGQQANNNSATPGGGAATGAGVAGGQMSPHPGTPSGYGTHGALSPSQQTTQQTTQQTNSPGGAQQTAPGGQPTYTQLAPSTAPSRGRTHSIKGLRC